MTDTPVVEPTDATVGLLGDLSAELKSSFVARRTLLSFTEYFDAFRASPRQHARSVAQYIRDMFDHFGTEEFETPQGTVQRFKLFDMAFADGKGRLVGQEAAQNAIYQALTTFTRERRVTRLLLLHGPNGSAKSSLISCIIRGLEHYSTLEEGALYRFNWIFPTEKINRSSIGFEQTRGSEASQHLPTFAHLSEPEIDAKLIEELRDNPLFLLPLKHRQQLLLEIFGDDARDADADGFTISDYIFEGDLSHKSRLIFDALLASYGGDYAEVLKHVQVERFYISRRYRQGAVTVEPQLRVDAGSRQVTADRSLSALPTSLQNQTLFEPFGDLVDGNRGIIEYNDLLKRHPDLNKYLLGTIEKGLVPVDHALLYIDTALVGSANEEFLEAFKGQPEYPSFKGRLELIRMPYLLDFEVEQKIYDQMLEVTEVGKDVAPHTTHILALWAVLSRMDRPDPEKHPASIRDVIKSISPIEKAELYANGRTPDGLPSDQARELRGRIAAIVADGAGRPLHYEGRHGLSPREAKNLLLRAAQRDQACLGPISLFEELEVLVTDPTVYPFLRIQADGPYRNHAGAIDVVRERYVDLVDGEVRTSMGLVDSDSYGAYFSRYVSTLSHALKGEKMYDRVTGAYSEPSEEFMAEVERALGVTTDAGEFRRDIISAVAAFRIDNPDDALDYATIFPELFIALEDSFFSERRAQVQKIEENLLDFIRGDTDDLDEGELEQVRTTLDAMRDRFGYCEHCAQEAIAYLLRYRYAAELSLTRSDASNGDEPADESDDDDDESAKTDDE